jgi:hypothetical protein
MITETKQFGNGQCLTPLKLDKNFGVFEDENCEELQKSHTSFPSTIDSAPFSPNKSLTLDSDIEEDYGCPSFHLAAHCPMGTQCTDIHEHPTRLWSRCFMLENYPELVARKHHRRIISFLP